MSTIIKFIEEEQVRKRNVLLDSNKCGNATEIAIKAVNSLEATLFVKTLFDTSLVQSKAIVDAVKTGMSVYTAYINIVK